MSGRTEDPRPARRRTRRGGPDSGTCEASPDQPLAVAPGDAPVPSIPAAPRFPAALTTVAPGADLLEAYRGTAEFAAVREAISSGGDATLGGFAGASLPFLLAALDGTARCDGLPSAPGAPAPSVACPIGPAALILTASEERAEELREEIAAFGAATRIFPAWESLFHPDVIPDGATFRDRLEALIDLGRGGGPRWIVAPVHAAIQPVAPAAEVLGAGRRIAAGDRVSPAALARDLDGSGLRRVPLVEKRGEFSLRGDILDIFPYDGPHAVRIEFFGDAVESVRDFRPETQKSLSPGPEQAREFFLPRRGSMFRDCFQGTGGESLIFDHLPEGSRVILWDPPAVLERAGKIFHNLLAEGDEETSAAFFRRMRSRPIVGAREGPAPAQEGSLGLDFGTVERFRGLDLSLVIGQLAARLADGWRIDVWCENAAEGERFQEILRDQGVDPAAALRVRMGPIRRGFSIGCLRSLVLSSRELFNRQVVRRVRRREVPGRPIQSFLDLSPGDHVVHIVHGVGRFRGTETLQKEGVLQEFLALEYRDGVVVYVPVSKIDLVQKYVGAGGRSPLLDKVGGSSWSRKKEEVERAVVDFASELLEIQALRSEKSGIASPADTEWQRQFEAAFPFDDTPDQVEATVAIKHDMESPRPMDRLLCGDVGYGKTELAMRAAFKTVNAGRQVAMLVPTTVLAEQHGRTFRERMAEFPVRIESISRFRSAREQREIVEATARGDVDILIGTHRILSADVAFQDLGLVVIDEEQRFGVAAKERLKRFRSLVDILTLTATPIPRTLHMSLLGIRDISNLVTPPEGRSPILTEVMEMDRRRTREIILRELNRDGQVYFVHNRVQDIARVQWELEQLVPEARIDHGHGQMSEDELEDIMMRFLEGRIDVLVSTTIIESGIDISNVNTIFIDEADRYGLADLHQLRGRVGRGRHQAYCYLVLPEHRTVNPEACKRIQALREFAELGAGFQIAMRDLEIRGAGNILGPEQSGHIALVGYEMYCRLLERSVHRLRNEEHHEPVYVEVNLNLEAYIPEEYLAGGAERLDLYRRISCQRDPEGVAEIARELEDRFGEPPAPARRLLELSELRALASRRGMVSISREGDRLILKGDERMKGLLDGAGRRVQVMDPRTAAVLLEKPRIPGALRRKEGLTDEEVFRAALEWLRTGTLSEPRSVFQAAREKSISQPRERR